MPILSVRSALAASASLLLAACAGLPSSGPTAKQVIRETQPDMNAMGMRIVEVDATTIAPLTAAPTDAAPVSTPLTWDELPSALTKNVGHFLGPVSPERVVASYRAWYPDDSPSDVFFAATTAFRSWPGQVIEAERRAANPEAAKRTWVYQMNWQSPVAKGRFGAPHTVDIPFFFDNLRLAPGMVGTGAAAAAAQPLADAMSSALLAFARTGDPNCAAVPHWPTYDLTERLTMLWQLPPKVDSDPRGQERRLAAQAHYRQPGT